MKRIIFIIIFLLCIFLILLYKTNTTEPTDTENTKVSKTHKKIISKETIVKRIKQTKSNQRRKYNWLEGYDKENDNTPEVGLIQAFREFQKVKRCRPIIGNTKSHSQHYQRYLEYINKNRKPENEKYLTIVQKQYFDIWSESCLDFMNSTDEPYTSVHERYRKRFYQTKAKTKVEKDFAKSWPLKEITHFINFKYRTLIKLELNSRAKKKLINREIKRIKGRLSYININDDIDFSERTQGEINMYKSQLKELSAIIDGDIKVDDIYLVNLQLQYDENFKTVDSFLRQNISSEAFVTLAQIVFKNKAKELGFYDERYFHSLLNPVTELFSCSMDAQCDSVSKVMIRNCFLNYNFSSELACGLSIEDYYLSYYFSPNQLPDINHIINFFFDNYVHD